MLVDPVIHSSRQLSFVARGYDLQSLRVTPDQPSYTYSVVGVISTPWSNGTRVIENVPQWVDIVHSYISKEHAVCSCLYHQWVVIFSKQSIVSAELLHRTWLLPPPTHVYRNLLRRSRPKNESVTCANRSYLFLCSYPDKTISTSNCLPVILLFCYNKLYFMTHSMRLIKYNEIKRDVNCST